MRKIKIFIIITIFQFLNVQAQNNIGIGTTSPAPSAMLDIESTGKGILIPRTDTTLVSSPATGLLIFQSSDNTFYYFNGVKWKSFSGIPSFLSDADGDTKVYVEKNPDEDIVRIDLGGQEKIIFNRHTSGAVNLEFVNSNNNTLIGEGAGILTNVNGFSNVAVGKNALTSNGAGDGNTAIGFEALESLINTNTGVGQTAVGYRALYNQTGTDPVTAIGYESAYLQAGGGHNTSVGYRSLYTGGGSWNTAVGHQALYSINTFAQRNTGLGFEALYSNVEHDDNTALGAYALRNSNGGSSNTAIGARSMNLVISGFQNVSVGTDAMFSTQNGSQNTAVGHFSLNENISGGTNVAVGYNSMRRTKTNGNSALGAYALENNINGASNVAIGFSSLINNLGSENTAVGYNALMGNTIGISNSAIGYGANVSQNNFINATAIGANAVVSASNCMVLGNNVNVGIGLSLPLHKLHVQGNAFISGTVTASCGVLTCSDTRYKKNISRISNILPSLIQLSGVYYQMNVNEFPDKNFNEDKQIGLLAQEVERVFPEIVYNDQDGYKSIDYSKLTPILIEAVKELKAEIDILKKFVENK